MKKFNLSLLRNIIFICFIFSLSFAKDNGLKLSITRVDLFQPNQIIAQSDNCISIEKIYEDRVSLNGTIIRFNAKVLNINNNPRTNSTWLHLSDSSSNVASNIMIHTSLLHEDDLPKIDDIVNVEGILQVNVSKEQGYYFPVLIENATINQLR
jgi:hypothetical protein